MPRLAEPDWRTTPPSLSGHPAYVFERTGDMAQISLAVSQTGDGEGFLDWGRELCPLNDLLEEIDAFLAALDKSVASACPAGIGWVAGLAASAVNDHRRGPG